MTTLWRQWRDWVHPKWPFVLVVLSTVMMALSLLASVDAQRQSARAAVTAQQTADDTHGALCALREDYRSRVEQSEQFLKSHPNGYAGISAEVIQSSLDNYRRTLRVFGRLDC